MKITRGQLRAFLDRTEGFVDELELELEEGAVGTVSAKFHHIQVRATRDGTYEVRNMETRELLREGHVEPITNDGWNYK